MTLLYFSFKLSFGEKQCLETLQFVLLIKTSVGTFKGAIHLLPLLNSIFLSPWYIMKLRVDIPAETKISIKHKQKGGRKEASITKNLWLKVDLFPLFFSLSFFFNKHMVCFRYLKCYYRSRISLVIIMKRWALSHSYTQPPNRLWCRKAAGCSLTFHSSPVSSTCSAPSPPFKDLHCFFPGRKGGGKQNEGAKGRDSLTLPFFYQSPIIRKCYLEILTYIHSNTE